LAFENPGLDLLSLLINPALTSGTGFLLQFLLLGITVLLVYGGVVKHNKQRFSTLVGFVKQTVMARYSLFRAGFNFEMSADGRQRGDAYSATKLEPEPQYGWFLH